jgi:beta-aspartyl-peptidase (threonine type)
MELTPHILMGGAAAECLAGEAGLRLCRPESLISPRARERWRNLVQFKASQDKSKQPGFLRNKIAQAKGPGGKAVLPDPDSHGTVGAAALDASGNLAAATSTGGVASKLSGRIGDSAIFGAGLFASDRAVASATGEGEAILETALCRSAVERMGRQPPQTAAVAAIERFAESTGRDAGIIMLDKRGRFGYAHNADAMEVATYHPQTGLQHHLAPNLARSRRVWPPQ